MIMYTTRRKYDYFVTFAEFNVIYIYSIVCFEWYCTLKA
jgi:hypothetical protein